MYKNKKASKTSRKKRGKLSNSVDRNKIERTINRKMKSSKNNSKQFFDILKLLNHVIELIEFLDLMN
ncbi:MAG: hypothetical protein CMP76_04690 [Flavobacterium sp.]|nr:hypothetical protein [Flavobacterium sp.]|tara:strand:+ start:2245 stop:2445 length:201 start_codon:yes stop_codon:yes gene_type:complete